jgi:hypothetical protein
MNTHRMILKEITKQLRVALHEHQFELVPRTTYRWKIRMVVGAQDAPIKLLDCHAICKDGMLTITLRHSRNRCNGGWYFRYELANPAFPQNFIESVVKVSELRATIRINEPSSSPYAQALYDILYERNTERN